MKLNYIYKKLLPIVILLSLSINCLAMQNFTTKIEVLGKSPKQIYDFMFQLDNEKYKAWHNEHRDFRIIKQTADTLGSMFFFDEKMDKLTVKYKWVVKEILPNHKIMMKAKFIIPIYLILTFDETPKGTLVTHDLQVGYKKTFTGFTDWFVRSFVFTKTKQKSQDRHAIEEFKNLEKLI